jgi:hypothetical protein
MNPFSYTLNGYTFGVGGDLQLVSETGLRSLPAIRQGDASKPRFDGSFAGPNYMDERIVQMTLSLVGQNTSVPYETVIANAAAAFQPQSDPTQLSTFQFMYPGWSNARQVTGRITKSGFPVDANYVYHFIQQFGLEFTCPDPLIYDTVLQTVTTGLPSPTAGLGFNVSFNASFGASSGGSMSVTNSGNYPTAPVFTITGPCTNPSITLTSTGQFFGLNLSLGASDSLVIDMGARTVYLDSTGERFNAITTGSSWFTIPVGTWSIGVASSDSAAVTATFTVAFRNAWSWC